MLKTIKKLLYCFLLIVLFPGAAAAVSFPDFPMAFWGTATIDGQVLLSGTKIKAFCGSDLIGEVTMLENEIYGYADSTKIKLLLGNCSGDILFKYLLSGTTNPLTGGSEIKYTNGFEEGKTVNKNLEFINTRSCSITNGTGKQTWDNNVWGDCTVSSCNSGYHQGSNSCVVDSTSGGGGGGGGGSSYTYSTYRAITAFSFVTFPVTGVINESTHSIVLNVPFGTNITNLVPTIVVSSKARISPNSGVAQNFTNSVIYTVTAENNSTQAYTVRVVVLGVGEVAGAATTRGAKPEDYGLKEGNLIRAEGDFDIFIINQYGYKRLFLNPAIFNMYGHLGSWKDVITVTSAVRDAFITSSHYRYVNESKVYHLEVTGEDIGTLHWINMTAANFFAQGGVTDAIFTINKSELDWYPKGAEKTSL